MENNKENKKIIVPTIIAVATLVILTIGATYAYFVVTSNNNFGTPSIEATTPEIGSVALTAGDNLTMSLTASQMMVGSEDVTYYASSEGTTTTATTANIGTATVTGAGSYTCDYTLTVEDNENSLYDAFQSMSTKTEGQMLLTVNGVEYDFNTASLFPKTISGTMSGLTSDKSQNITAQLKLVNKVNVDQSALAGKTLTLTFTATNFKCTAEEENTNQGVSYVLATASSSDIWESTLEDDGIRFVGTDPSNYVCFGYDDASEDCDFTNATNTDLYAYRIIGIFEDSEGIQHLKLIKKEALNKTYAWHNDTSTDTDWDESDLYKGLNGSYFLDNETYSYMQDTNWTNKITTWTWTATNPDMDYYSSMAKQIYLDELNRNSKTSNAGEWETVSSKISLMYVSDYLLSLGSSALEYTSATNYETLKTGWMYISNNDSGATSNDEWSMTRYGESFPDSGWYYALYVVSEGFVGNLSTDMPYSVRPVFHLTTDVKISGEGTTTNPFIVS